VLCVALLLQAGAPPPTAATPPVGWTDYPPSAWQAPAPPPPPPPPAEDEARSETKQRVEHTFLLRAGLGVGFLRPSAHDEVLEADGYDLDSRAELVLAGAGVVAGRVALGAYVGIGRGTASPTSEAPTLRQTVVRAGTEISLVLQPSATTTLLLGPELGVLQGTLSVQGDGRSQTVLEYGGKLGAYFRVSDAPPVWYLGSTLGYTLAPADPPGALGRDYDYGALHLDFTVVLGG